MNKITFMALFCFFQANFTVEAKTSFFNAFTASYMGTGSILYLCGFLMHPFLDYIYSKQAKKERPSASINLMEIFEEKMAWAKTLPDDDRIRAEKKIADAIEEFKMRGFDPKKIIPALPVNNKSITEDGNMEALAHRVLISHWWFDAFLGNDERQKNKFFGVLRHEFNHVNLFHNFKFTMFSSGTFFVLSSVVLHYGNMLRKIIIDYTEKNCMRYSIIFNNIPLLNEVAKGIKILYKNGYEEFFNRH